MNLLRNTHGSPSRRAFTLVELLVVLAIIAVVGSGVAVTYGRKNVEEAKDRMTLHEMGEIKKAFLQFENDNYHRLQNDLAGHDGTAFPTTAYLGQFDDDHVLTGQEDADVLLKGQMQFFETYGLWFLMQPTIYDVDVDDRDGGDADYAFPSFTDYSSQTLDGWNGPYLDSTTRGDWNFGTESTPINFPQIADKHGSDLPTDTVLFDRGVYLMMYFEHEPADRDVIYRRLVLVSPRRNANFDELSELMPLTGNLRSGATTLPASHPFDLDTASFKNRDTSPYFVLELLNRDKRL